MIPQTFKAITGKKNVKPSSVMNIDAKLFNKMHVN